MVTTETYRIDIQLRSERPSVTLRGVIDAGAAQSMSELLRPLLTVEKPFLLDLGDVESMDADGIAPLLELCSRRRHPAVITAASPAAARAISELDLPPTLTVMPDFASRRSPRGHKRSGADSPTASRAPGSEVAAPRIAVRADREPVRPSGTEEVPWPLAVSRLLRAQESVEDVMRRVEELAPEVTGCLQARLITGKPKDRQEAGNSALDTFLQELAVDCLAAEDHFLVADLSGQSQLLSSEATDSTGSAAAAVAWYLASGAGRRPAALLLTFSASRAADDHVLETVDAYAEVADVALAHQHANEQLVSLRTALESNREIGTAMGILMATRHIDDEEAFGLLRSVSQHTHRKLNVIASEVVYTGMLPV